MARQGSGVNEGIQGLHEASPLQGRGMLLDRAAEFDGCTSTVQGVTIQGKPNELNKDCAKRGGEA
eukprot:2956971-Amphidinium_carterae.1